MTIGTIVREFSRRDDRRRQRKERQETIAKNARRDRRGNNENTNRRNNSQKSLSHSLHRISLMSRENSPITTEKRPTVTTTSLFLAATRTKGERWFPTKHRRQKREREQRRNCFSRKEQLTTPTPSQITTTGTGLTCIHISSKVDAFMLRALRRPSARIERCIVPSALVVFGHGKHQLGLRSEPRFSSYGTSQGGRLHFIPAIATHPPKRTRRPEFSTPCIR